MPAPRRPLLGYAQQTALLGDGSVMSQYDPTFREKATDYLRGLLFSDDREGQRKAERLSNVLETVTPYGVATGVDDAAGAFGQGDMMTGGLMLGMAGLPGPSPKGIRAYHGSPHSFDKFSMDKIGTGEGAQAYGHGLYFAENEGVAKGYRDALTDPDAVPLQFKGRPVDVVWDDDIAERWNDVISNMRPQQADDFKAVMSNLTQVNNLQDVKNVLASLTPSQRATYQRYVAPELMKPDVPPGSMYEVNINADPESFLDWDAPLSAQPESVKGFAGTLKDKSFLARKRLDDETAATGRDVWEKARNAYGVGKVDEATAKLREAGIPGIKYLDAGSRAKGDGSRNYVVFDDNLISIVRKYGIAGASAMLGYNILDGMNEAQAAQLKQAEAK
jgi:hypothetical protein